MSQNSHKYEFIVNKQLKCKQSNHNILEPDLSYHGCCPKVSDSTNSTCAEEGCKDNDDGVKTCVCLATKCNDQTRPESSIMISMSMTMIALFIKIMIN